MKKESDVWQEICPECELPIVECTAVAIARNAARDYLREAGYPGMKAVEFSQRIAAVDWGKRS